MSRDDAQLITIGKILSAHGKDGLVKVFPYSDFPERCHDLREVTVEQDGARRRVVVERASVFGRFWLIKFQGVSGREEGARLSGGLLQIQPEERVVLPAGSYYFDQIIGLPVYTGAGDELGRITDIISTGGHDLYILKHAGREGKDLIIPAVKEFVKEIDPAAGRVVVDLPAGLRDL